MRGVGDSQGGFMTRLAAAFAHTPDIRLHNLGIGGNTTRDMLHRVPDVEAVTPREIIVLLGCNDVPRANDKSPANRTSIDQYAANLSAILPRIKGERCLFISSFRVCDQRTGVSLGTLRQYMEVAIATARQNDYEVWDLFADSFDKASTYWAPDGMHFNDAGHQMIAEHVVGWIATPGSPAAPGPGPR